MKLHPKVLLAIVLAAALASSVFFTRITAQEGLEYDPWEDINEDGIIDILDLVHLSNSYAATGNPAKNVTMKLACEYGHYHLTDVWVPEVIYVDTAGYREITLTIAVSDMSLVEFSWYVDGTGGNWAYFTEEYIEFSDPGWQNSHRTFTVKGAILAIHIDVPIGPLEVYVGYYKTA